MRAGCVGKREGSERWRWGKGELRGCGALDHQGTRLVLL